MKEQLKPSSSQKMVLIIMTIVCGARLVHL